MKGRGAVVNWYYDFQNDDIVNIMFRGENHSKLVRGVSGLTGIKAISFMPYIGNSNNSWR